MFSSAVQLQPPSRMASVCDAVWVLLTESIGDNDQCLALAAALDVPVIAMRLDWKASDPAHDRSMCKELLADTPQADQERRALGLHAPWPQVIIGCGRRSDRIGLWIKAQSVGWTKYIGIGRAHRPIAQYDLLVAPPQFALPSRSNIVPLCLPLGRSRNEVNTVAPVAGHNGGAANDLVPVPKPWFSILLGGEVKEFVTSERELTRVARRAQAAADRHGGSVVVSSSRRTPANTLAAVEAALDGRAHIYRWSTSSTNANPYGALLEQSSALFVTADSASMIVDACSSGTPTYIVEYPERLDLRRRWRRWMFSFIRQTVALCGGLGWRQVGQSLDLAQEWLHERGVLRYPRDLRRLHARIYAMGLARPLMAFDPETPPARSKIANDLARRSDLRGLIARCRALL